MKKDAFEKIDQHFRGYQSIVSVLNPDTVYEKRQSYLVRERQLYFDQKLLEFIEKNPSFGQRYVEKYGTPKGIIEPKITTPEKRGKDNWDIKDERAKAKEERKIRRELATENKNSQFESPSTIEKEPRETVLRFIQIGAETIGAYGDYEGLKQIYDKHGWPFPQNDLIGPDGKNYGRGCSFTFQWAGIMFEEMKEMGWGVSEGYDIIFSKGKGKNWDKDRTKTHNETALEDINYSDVLDVPINALTLPSRAANILMHLGCKTLADIPQIETSETLLKVRNCGRRTVFDIENFLKKINLHFGMSYDIIVEQIDTSKGNIVKKRAIPKTKGNLSESALVTLDYINRGYSLKAIASDRHLSVKTITLQAAKLIYLGKADVHDFVDEQEYAEISNVIKNLEKKTQSAENTK